MKKNINRVVSFALFLALAITPEFTMLRQASAQGPLNLRALGIDNEARQFTSLLETQAKFFTRASELKRKTSLTPQDPRSLREEADKRKADLSAITQALQALINKLKQGNNWNEAFDAQFAAGLKRANHRSLLTQVGGARKLFEAAVNEVNSFGNEIDEEVRQINTRQTSAIRSRGDRVFAAHARPPAGKVCTFLLTAILLTSFNGFSLYDCVLVNRYNDKDCVPSPLDTTCG